MKIGKSLEEFGLLIKGVSEAIKNEAKERTSKFLDMLLGIFGACLLRNMLAGKGVVRAANKFYSSRWRSYRADEGQDF